MENLITLALALTFAVALPTYAQGKDPNNYTDDIPKGDESRKGDRYPYDPRFPKEEIKFIGQVDTKDAAGNKTGTETHEYDDVMEQYLSKATIADIKSRKMQWLIVRYPTQDANYRMKIDEKTVDQAVIIDVRYVPAWKIGNGTLHVVYNVREVDGRPTKFNFVKFVYDPEATQAMGDTLVGAKDLAKAVLTDVISRVYQLTPVNRQN